MKALLNIHAPTSQKEVRHFCGLFNFYKRFYKEKSKTLAPITALKGKYTKFNWTQKCE